MFLESLVTHVLLLMSQSSTYRVPHERELQEWRHHYEHTMTIVAAIQGKNDTFVTDGPIYAYCDGEIRGVQETTLTPPFGPFRGIGMYFMMIYGRTSGEIVTLKNRAGNFSRSIVFAVDGSLGSAVNPVVLSYE